MEKVIVKVKHAGSIEVNGMDAKEIYGMIHDTLFHVDNLKVIEIKRGPKKKVKDGEEK